MIVMELKSMCNERFLQFICDRSTFISFRIDGWKKSKKGQVECLYKQMNLFLIDEYCDDIYLDSYYGNISRISVFYMNSIFREYFLNNIDISKWQYPKHPEDPAFYREDERCLLHVNIHEGICFYYPCDEKEKNILNELKICYAEHTDYDNDFLKLVK